MNPRRRLLLRTWCGTVALLLAAACSDGGTTPPEPTGPPGLHVVSGGGTADSIQAVLAPLVVEVRDTKGRPMSGIGVEFTARVVPGTSIPAVYVRTSDAYSGTAVAVTDAVGRVTLNLATGAYAGPAYVVFGVRSLGLLDSARYEVRPGALARLTAFPRDTLVMAGASYPLRLTREDRQGNPTPFTPVLTPRSPSVSTSGTTVRAETFGRTRVIVQAGTQLDSLWVTVVPRGTLAVVDGHRGLATVETDGTGRRDIHGTGRFPRWMPDGQTLVFSDYSDGRGALRRIHTGTGSGASLLSGEDPPDTDANPHPGRDGEWIYFSRYMLAQSFDWSSDTAAAVWRVRPDGTGAAPVPGSRTTERTS